MLKTFSLAALPERRSFLKGAGTSVLSATAVALIVGCETRAGSQQAATQMQHDPAADAEILNVALGLEHQAVGAYQLGAESGLLAKPVLDVAVLFQSHHKQHVDALAATIRQLGGTPVEPRQQSEYAQSLNASSLKTDRDVLNLALDLEKGATDAYLGVIPSFTDADLAQVSGKIAADEAMHWAVLASALGLPLPQQAFVFG